MKKAFQPIVYTIIILGAIAYYLYDKETTRPASYSYIVENESAYSREELHEPANLKQVGPWVLEDLNRGEVRSSMLEGNVVLVNFWATWCGVCISDIPLLVELQDQFKDEGLKVVGISLDLDLEDTGELKDFAKALKINYPVLLGNKRIVADFGDIKAIPSTFLIDRKGNVIKYFLGKVPREEITNLIEQAL